MSLTVKQITEPLRDGRFVLIALAANFIVPPAAAFLLIRAFSLDEPLAVGLLLVSLAAGAPGLPKTAVFARVDTAVATGLMVLLVVVTIIVLPIALPLLLTGNSQLLFGGMGRLIEHSVISIKNKSHSVTADILAPEGGAEGVIVAQGGMWGGWSLYAKEGKLKYCYNLLGHKTWFVESEGPIPSGAHQVRVEFAYDGGGIGKGGLARLFIDGQNVGSGRVEETHALGFSADETCDVGQEAGSPVSPDYGPRGNEFSGEVNWVQIDLGLDDHSHMVTPEQRLSFAIARQ